MTRQHYFGISTEDKKDVKRATEHHSIRSKSIALVSKEITRKKKINQLRKSLNGPSASAIAEKEKLSRMTENQKFLYNTKKQLQQRKSMLNQRRKTEYLRFLKKQACRYKDLQSPENKQFNIYKKIPDLYLKRCRDNMKCSQVWEMLKECWVGFNINHAINYKDGYIHYAKGIQRAVYLLELPPMRDFEKYLGLRPYTFKDEIEL